MARPVTLFTGQWADLPLDELAAKCAVWGFDGLELACWGDHFEVDRAVADPAYANGQRELLERHGLGVLGDRRAPRRPGGLRPDRRAPPGDPAARGLGRRRGGRRSRARGGADEGHRAGGGAARRDAGERVHRLVDLAPALLVPAERLRRDRARLRGVRRAVGADHRRVRRGGRPLRARGAPDGDRLRLRHDAARRSTRSATARRSGSTSTRATSRTSSSTPRSSRSSSPTGSTTSTSRTRASASTGAGRSSARTSTSARRRAAGTSSRRATATSTSRSSSGR